MIGSAFSPAAGSFWLPFTSGDQNAANYVAWTPDVTRAGSVIDAGTIDYSLLWPIQVVAHPNVWKVLGVNGTPARAASATADSVFDTLGFFIGVNRSNGFPTSAWSEFGLNTENIPTAGPQNLIASGDNLDEGFFLQGGSSSVFVQVTEQSAFNEATETNLLPNFGFAYRQDRVAVGTQLSVLTTGTAPTADVPAGWIIATAAGTNVDPSSLTALQAVLVVGNNGSARTWFRGVDADADLASTLQSGAGTVAFWYFNEAVTGFGFGG